MSAVENGKRRPSTEQEHVPTPSGLRTFFLRMHFYIGLFVGPFIFIAALTGTLYVLTPQLENRLYAHALYTNTKGTPQPLSLQVAAGMHALGHGKNTTLSAVRPAPLPGETTRVMFSSPDLGPSESRALFIDPVSLAIRGDLTVYGTSGILPFRLWLDNLHRSLLLGSVGRNYSELAASWLWIAALGGAYLWWTGRQPHINAKKTGAALSTRRRLRRCHTVTGLALLAGLLFFSATGLTWSRWAGDNISQLRYALGWQTPAVATQLSGNAESPPYSEHAHHMMMDVPDMTPIAPARFDRVLASARSAGIEATKIEIRPTSNPHRAWTVTEMERRWPTRADAVAVDPGSGQVVSKVAFNDFPLAAKLTRWGVDIHMGVLFGWPNQLLLTLFGVGLCTMIVWGYRLWWLRRPRGSVSKNPLQSVIEAFLSLSLTTQVLLAIITLGIGIFLPVLGISAVMFILIDSVRWLRYSHSLPKPEMSASRKKMNRE
ncbi:PepSY-associated TM helix domain-containing protein [Lonsdalea populi]|uniref:PepSY domain-containing protein n=1 Tax=Lonsdalea populi TaxID=1172565 RepID=A0A3N0U959_9GAMM|nr:PepSY-associated TM helix domain-containing protein [Lonsdalea populi]ROH76644.1 PepSY domain-containing protein [Lonsdalea populi]ROH78076.1 PepSY domain-containing protein [Lonsdalea populi]